MKTLRRMPAASRRRKLAKTASTPPPDDCQSRAVPAVSPVMRQSFENKNDHLSCPLSPPNISRDTGNFMNSVPASPFSAFASNLGSLNSVEKKVPTGSLHHAPASPFGGFASALPNLAHASPANIGRMMEMSPPHISNSSPKAGNFSIAQSPAGASSVCSSKSFMSPVGNPSWAPLSSKKVRRTLMCAEDMGSMGQPNAFSSLLSSPHTPSMQVLCFGEHEVSANTTPTTIGSLGDFVNRPGSRSGTRNMILSGPSKKKSKSGCSSIRRNLDSNLSSPQVQHGKEQRSADTSSSSSACSSNVVATPSSRGGTTSAAVTPAIASTSTTGTRSKSKPQAAKVPPPPAPALLAKTLAPVNNVSGSLLAALGAMPPLGTAPPRQPGAVTPSAKTTSQQPPDKSLSSAQVKKEGAPCESPEKKEARDPSKLCKCKKSKCVRQYCVCFRAGLLCDGCDCNDCFNDGKHEVERLAAIEHIKTSDPLAFVEKIRDDNGQPDKLLIEEMKDPKKHHVRGCRCKNSRCLKKYCECFEHGVACSAKCECRDCQNNKPGPNDAELPAPALLPSKKRKEGSSDDEADYADFAASSAKKMASAMLGAAAAAAFGAAAAAKITHGFLNSAPQTPQRTADFHLLVPMTPVEQTATSCLTSKMLNMDFSKQGLGTTPCSSTHLHSSSKQAHAQVLTPQERACKLVSQLPLSQQLPPDSPACIGFSLEETPSKDLGLACEFKCRRRPSDTHTRFHQSPDSTAKEVDFLDAVDEPDAASLEAAASLLSDACSSRCSRP